MGRIKHGESRSAIEYKSWESMKSRCYNKNNVAYHLYGGRGIVVCDRWKTSYENFLQDMGRRPDKTYTLDRINPDGNYGPNNCRWATKRQQGYSRRTTHDSGERFIGVYERKWKNTYYEATVTNNGYVYLGLFKCKYEAATIVLMYYDNYKIDVFK